jgi:hypothetical protein
MYDLKEYTNDRSIELTDPIETENCPRTSAVPWR